MENENRAILVTFLRNIEEKILSDFGVIREISPYAEIHRHIVRGNIADAIANIEYLLDESTNKVEEAKKYKK